MTKQKRDNSRQILEKLKPRYFFIAACVLFVISALGMRANNIRAIELRDQVLAADKANKDVEAALRELREHVYSHMNSNLATDTSVYPPIQLKYRYERLVKAEQDRVSKQTENIYKDAQAYCERQNSVDFSGRNRVPCIQDYVTKRTIKQKTIPDSLYKFDFASPRWSPDLAGWSILLAFLSLVLWSLRLFVAWFIHRYLD